MSLENIISKSIKDNNNPIGFDVFMNLALYHQEFGYYRSNKKIFGHRGDFITSPEISDLFGFSLAKQCKQVLNGGNILEFGAGSGILAAQILFELGRMESLPKKYFIIELSSQLRQTQKETIKKVLPEVFDRGQKLSRERMGVHLGRETGSFGVFALFARTRCAMGRIHVSLCLWKWPRGVSEIRVRERMRDERIHDQLRLREKSHRDASFRKR